MYEWQCPWLAAALLHDIGREAQVIFDADKLDVTGAIGIARTIAYKGVVAQPMYSVGEDGHVLSGDGKEVPSSITAANFYESLSYVYSDGIPVLGDDKLYEIEKVL